MRPILTLLLAKNFGTVNESTQNAALGLELLHTASLVHDDVVDESDERRGQPSVNASFNNKVAVLVGDYILSTALLRVSQTGDQRIVENLAQLGQTLAAGEILQLTNIQNQDFSEEVYYQVIKKKTAALFESCAALGALSAGASEEVVSKAALFGQNLGIIFQIRDDIFDYFDSKEIGKPTGNDMVEGKLTLPVLYALNKTHSDSMITLARKVKAGTINRDEIAVLVAFTKEQGGIEYADKRMLDYHAEAKTFIDEYVKKAEIRDALIAYLDYVVRAVELGATLNSKLLTLNCAAWHHHGRQMIDWIMDTTKGDAAVWQSVNHTRLNSYGLETSATLYIPRTSNNPRTSYLAPRTSISITYSYIHQEKDLEPGIVSQYAMEYLRHKLVVGATLPLTTRLTLHANVRWQDRAGQYTDFDGSLCDYRPYTLVDARLSWRQYSHELYVKANNLLNTSYRDHGLVPQPGRWVIAGVQISM